MNKKPLAGRTIAILVANGFDEVQFTGPQKHLIELGAAVKVVSRVKSLVNGWYEGNWGHFFPVNVDASETLAIDFDGLVIPGGIRSVDKLFDDSHAKRILNAFQKANMPVLLIGDSVKMLIAIEKVAGVSVTSSTIVKGALVEAKANWLALPFTKDKNLITGADSGDLEELVSEFSNIVDTYNPDVIEAA
ncbi:DJ-1/PfpI family protein [Alphaproteobacteria bacterium]|nr:DJ-1/PfpI family protein [Alphaproteobacteria bacterium]